jgi:hypothetical protein
MLRMKQANVEVQQTLHHTRRSKITEFAENERTKSETCISTRRRLSDLAKQQAEEIEILREESLPSSSAGLQDLPDEYG